MDIAQNIKDARERAGLCQKQLARALGVKQPTVCNWEKGKRVPSVRQTASIAVVCRVPLCRIVHGSECPDHSSPVEDAPTVPDPPAVRRRRTQAAAGGSR